MKKIVAVVLITAGMVFPHQALFSQSAVAPSACKDFNLPTHDGDRT